MKKIKHVFVLLGLALLSSCGQFRESNLQENILDESSVPKMSSESVEVMDKEYPHVPLSFAQSLRGSGDFEMLEFFESKGGISGVTQFVSKASLEELKTTFESFGIPFTVVDEMGLPHVED